MNPLQVELRRVEALVPYASNARTHSAAQINQIAASIQKFGWTNPLLIDPGNGIIADRALAGIALLAIARAATGEGNLCSKPASIAGRRYPPSRPAMMPW